MSDGSRDHPEENSDTCLFLLHTIQNSEKKEPGEEVIENEYLDKNEEVFTM